MPEMAAITANETRNLVLDFFPSERRTDPIIRALASILNDFIRAPDLRTRLDAFIELRQWITSRSGNFMKRLESVLALLESRDELRASFHQGVCEILTEIRSVELFAEAGLHPREGLWSEAVRRMLEELLPSAREDTDLSKFIFRLYPTSAAIEQLVTQPDELFERMVRVLTPAHDASAWSKQREDLIQAFYLLGVHIAGIGLSPGMRERSHTGIIEESPFYLLQQTSGELVRHNGAASVLATWHAHVQHCRDELEYVHARMEDSGVSTTLVFDMGTIERAMTRMESIAEVLFVADGRHSIAAVKRLLDDVMNARRQDMSLRSLFRENSALMARKVVERTGKAGEHYIANSRSEYWEIWRASLGGGLLTVLTAAVKMRIVEAHFPPFVEGMAAGTNYAVSFIALQYFHLALATKQPSVTAATFAGIVRRTRGKARLEKVSEFTSRITRSQLASAAGNLIAVCGGCVIFSLLWSWFFGEPYLDLASAEHVYESLNPLASGTVIFATLTGLILWVSALAGGWVENFAAFNNVPEAIAQHLLGRRFGRERMEKIAATVDANLSGWTTSIVLGYMLGFVPAVGQFFGIPLDVRHVTLNTGTLALAAASLGKDWFHEGWFFHTIFGIALTFVLNLGVSFSIAASVALKAYGVSQRERLRLVRYTFITFLQNPGRFIYPSAKDWNQEAVEDGTLSSNG
jgi:site-specific recombinase